MLSNKELNDLVAEIEEMPSTNSIKPYKHSMFEHVAARLASKVIHNAELLGESFVLRLASKGKKFLDKQLHREELILKRPTHISGIEFEQEYKGIEANIRKEIGSYDSTKFLNVLINMKDFCREFADYGDRNMMELNLPFGSANHIAAYFFKPVFYWDLFRARFAK